MTATSEMHTPGPWVITGVSQDTGNVSVGSKAQRIVIADVTNAASFGDMLSGAMRRGGGGFAQSDCATQFANADLIAAAPDLAAVVKAFVAHYPVGINPFLDAAYRDGRAALSRATSPTT